MSTRIQLRRGTATQWSNANPILAAGEIGVEMDTRKFKLGDGSTVWNSLAYLTSTVYMSQVQDVLANNPNDGSVLVYETNINKWVATTDLVKQNLDGGFF